MFLLALSLGCTVAELGERMSSSEFSEWMRYFELEPFGPWRDNFHAAQSAALLYNVNRGRNSKAMSVNDFMFKDEQTRSDEADMEFMAQLDALAVKKKQEPSNGSKR